MVLLGLILELPGVILAPRRAVWASILRVPARHLALLFDLAAIFAEKVKIMQKPMFSNGFSLILKVRRVSKSMKNLKKIEPGEL